LEIETFADFSEEIQSYAAGLAEGKILLVNKHIQKYYYSFIFFPVKGRIGPYYSINFKGKYLIE